MESSTSHGLDLSSWYEFLQRHVRKLDKFRDREATMADSIGHFVSHILSHANNNAIGIYSAVGDFVHRRAMVIAGILRYAAEQGSAMSASVGKVWHDFWRVQASMVVSTPPLSTEDKSNGIENIANDTSSNYSSSNATGKTARDTSRNDNSSDTSSTEAFFAGKRRRKAKRQSNRVKTSIQRLHEEALKKATVTAAAISATAQPAAPATSTVVPGVATGAARPTWQTLEDVTINWKGVQGKEEEFHWYRVNRSGH
eukprot:jgi/Undpi1/3449/HiC_scaffold_16.g06821.m1